MPYLNCEWSRERRTISEELKKVNDAMKKRKRKEAPLRQSTWLPSGEANSTERASYPAEKDDEKNETSYHAQPPKEAEAERRTSRASSQHSDSSTDGKSESGYTSSCSEGPPTPPKPKRRTGRELRRRLTHDINLISSYLDHEFPLHVSILSN